MFALMVDLKTFTSVEPAPFASTPLFKLQALIQVPDEMTDKQLEEGIEAVGKKEQVDMWLESSEPITSPSSLHEIPKARQ